MKYSVFALLFSVFCFSQDFKGKWTGSIEAGQSKIEFILDIKFENNLYSSTLSLPSQGLNSFPLSSTEVSNDALLVKSPQVQIEYKGILKDDSITGEMSLSGQKFPLVFVKSKEH